MKKIIVLLPILLFSNDLYYYNNGKKVQLTPTYNQTTQRGDGTSYYENEYGMKVGVNNQVLAKLKPTTLVIDIEQKYNVIFVKKLTRTIYVFETLSAEESINFSSSLVENAEAEFAHPDFIREIKRR